jgi:hypothetical protein
MELGSQLGSQLGSKLGSQLGSHNPPICAPYCSNCGAQGIHKEVEGLCKQDNKPINIDSDVNFKCKCGFTITNYLVHYFICECQTTRCRTNDHRKYRPGFDAVVSRFNKACNNKKYTIFEIEDYPQEQQNEILQKIKDVAKGYGMEMESYGGFEKTKKILKWLPLQKSQFYNESMTESITNMFK